MEYLIVIILNSLYIIGFYQSFQAGNIFAVFNPYHYFSRVNPDGIMAKWLLKPVIGCVVCMASVHGIIFLCVFRNYLYLDIPIVIFYIFALAGLNRIIYTIADL